MSNEAWMTVRLATKMAEADDIAAFELTAPDGIELPPFSAGAHIDVEIAPNLIRQYSLCNHAGERHRYVIGVLKEPNSRGGSTGLHAFTPGAHLRISTPRNHFALDTSATRSVLLGGGIGVTPLLCMAEALAHRGADFDLHYCSRSPSRAGFCERIAASAYVDRVQFHFDDGAPAQKLDIDAALGLPTPGVHLYVCGPAGFMDFVLKAAAAKGFAQANIHREYFSAGDVQWVEGAAFQVKLASSGQLFEVAAERSVLDTLRDAGIELGSSCEQGVCGSCVVGVLEGVPDHRDFFLTAEEQSKGNQFAPCCSRSKTPILLLDL